MEEEKKGVSVFDDRIVVFDCEFAGIFDYETYNKKGKSSIPYMYVCSYVTMDRIDQTWTINEPVLLLRRFPKKTLNKGYLTAMLVKNDYNINNIQTSGKLDFFAYNSFLRLQRANPIIVEDECFIDTIRSHLKGRQIWTSGSSMDKKLLNEDFCDKLELNDLQTQKEILFSKMNYINTSEYIPEKMKTRIANLSDKAIHCPDIEVAVFASVIAKSEPNLHQISYKDFASKRGDFAQLRAYAFDLMSNDLLSEDAYMEFLYKFSDLL